MIIWTKIARYTLILAIVANTSLSDVISYKGYQGYLIPGFLINWFFSVGAAQPHSLIPTK